MFLLINLFRDPVDVWDNVQCYPSAYQLLYLNNNNKASIHIGNNFLDYFYLSCASFKIPAVDTGHLYDLRKEFEMSVSGPLIIHDCIEMNHNPSPIIYNTQVKKFSSKSE